MNPLYDILSGFEVGNTPSVGTFYDLSLPTKNTLKYML